MIGIFRFFNTAPGCCQSLTALRVFKTIFTIIKESGAGASRAEKKFSNIQREGIAFTGIRCRVNVKNALADIEISNVRCRA